MLEKQRNEKFVIMRLCIFPQESRNHLNLPCILYLSLLTLTSLLSHYLKLWVFIAVFIITQFNKSIFSSVILEILNSPSSALLLLSA